ncbi:MAG: hypothetical protein R3F11_27150 [Verrucomicrobiales bacterium]
MLILPHADQRTAAGEHEGAADLVLRLDCPCCGKKFQIDGQLGVQLTRYEERPISYAALNRPDRPLAAVSQFRGSGLTEDELGWLKAHGLSVVLPKQGGGGGGLQGWAARAMRWLSVAAVAAAAPSIPILWITAMDHSAGTAEAQAIHAEQKAREHQMADEARATLAAFLDATTPEEKAAYVLDPARVLPLMQEYYGGGGSDAGIDAAQFYLHPSIVDPSNTERGIAILARAIPVGFVGGFGSLGGAPAAFDAPGDALTASLGGGGGPSAPPSAFSGAAQPPSLGFGGGETARAAQKLEALAAASAPRLYFFKGGKLDWETYIQNKDSDLRAYLTLRHDQPRAFRAILSRAGFATSDNPGEPVRIALNELCADQEILRILDVPAHTQLGKRLAARLEFGVPQPATIILTWEAGDPTLLDVLRWSVIEEED